MKTALKTALIAATVAGGLFATTASAQTTALLPVDRFVVSQEARTAFDANLTTLGVDVRPGDTLTAKERDFAGRVMSANIYDSTKASIIRALYADDDRAFKVNDLY